MQPEIEGSEEMNKQNSSNNNINQDRRLKAEQNQQQQQQPPQKCPRCESLNTKFCYYNNYSLSQPRYFCKTCRRYWTQGGTLRNVPVGGGCRKGKRARTAASGGGGGGSTSSASADNSPAQVVLLPPTVPQAAAAQLDLTNPQVIMASSDLRAVEPAGSFGSQYFPGSGYLSSFAAVQSFNPNDHQTSAFDHHDLGGTGGASSSTLSLLQGFNLSQGRIQTTSSSQFYPSHEQSSSLINNQTSRLTSTNSSASHHQQQQQQQQQQHEWPQSFVNNSRSTGPETAAMWTIGAANAATSNVQVSTAGATARMSLNPNQWPDHDHLPGYGPPS